MPVDDVVVARELGGQGRRRGPGGLAEAGWRWWRARRPIRTPGWWSSTRTEVCGLVRLLAAEEGEYPEHQDHGDGHHDPGARTASVVHRVEGHALGPVGAGRRGRLAAARSGPVRSGRASSKTMGASGSGNSSVPRTGTGGTTRSAGAARTDRRAPPGPGARSAARCDPTGARGCRGRGCSCAPSGRRRPGVGGPGRRPRPPPPAPRRRTRRPTSGLFNPESVRPAWSDRGRRPGGRAVTGHVVVPGRALRWR